ncbi:MAG: hypothetical protein MJZ81_05205 [Bacteroidales bacterium]|nr:hypothetical protein [Bacteroidales bacterium]
MMYLVYTAMLALNVAAEVLNGFVTVGDAMEKSNQNLVVKLDDSYDNFKFAYENNKDKVADYWAQAQEVQKLSHDLVDTIDKMRYEFLCHQQSVANIKIHDEEGKQISRSIPLRDGANWLIDSAKVALDLGGINAIDKKDDNNDATNYFYGKDENPNGAGVRLKELIVEYKKNLKKTLGADTAKIKIGLNVEQKAWSDHAKAMVDWEDLNFNRTIAAADMVVLSRLKAEVMNAEFDAVQLLYKKVKANDFSFDKVSVITRPKSAYVIQGNKYETAINVGAYDSKAHLEVEIGGSKYTSDDSGTVHYSVPCTSVGNKTITGKIYVKKDSGTEVYEFKDNYFVAEPVAIVSLTKMNVVYAGIENPASISVPGIDPRNITPSIEGTGVTLTKDPAGKDGDYIIKASKLGKFSIRVDAKADGKTSRTMGTKEFRVKKIPAPTLMLGKLKPGEPITKDELMANTLLRADMGDFDFKIPPLKITSFTFNVQGSNALDIQGTGNKLTPDMTNRIKNAKRGQKVYISEVRVQTPDGVNHQLSVTYRLK